MITLKQVKENPAIKTYIAYADNVLVQLGYTEHRFIHINRVASVAKYILESLGYSEREIELAQIAGYLHDIGNLINRIEHAQSGAAMAFCLLNDMGADPEDIATICTAIGNHDESTAVAVSPVAAALIIADKADMRRSRVRDVDTPEFDIHDRVNYSVTNSMVTVSEDRSVISLDLEIDTSYCPIMDYFEIFLSRMTLCRKAAEKLGATFQLTINNQRIV
ncbi:MAG: HD domain-containing protein [Oscillospiraceae bacterium]|nr:HD domain-containing protein [Oscillospiraceae bacterium]